MRIIANLLAATIVFMVAMDAAPNKDTVDDNLPTVVVKTRTDLTKHQVTLVCKDHSYTVDDNIEVLSLCGTDVSVFAIPAGSCIKVREDKSGRSCRIDVLYVPPEDFRLK